MGLLLPGQPRTDDGLAIPDHPVSNQVFEALQTLTPAWISSMHFRAFTILRGFETKPPLRASQRREGWVPEEPASRRLAPFVFAGRVDPERDVCPVGSSCRLRVSARPRRACGGSGGCRSRRWSGGCCSSPFCKRRRPGRGCEAAAGLGLDGSAAHSWPSPGAPLMRNIFVSR